MRLIEADAVYKILESCEIKKDTYGSLLNDWDQGYNCGIERAESEIECAPTVEAEPVRHGKWNETNFMKVRECSCCHAQWGMYSIEEFDYCPSCGARMDGGTNGTD